MLSFQMTTPSSAGISETSYRGGNQEICSVMHREQPAAQHRGADSQDGRGKQLPVNQDHR